MRVLFCKIHCPSFICFCKPCSSLLYTQGPLKLENSTHVPSSATTTTAAAASAVVSVATATDSINGVKEEIVSVVVEGKQSQGLKSSLKKSSSLDSKQVERKTVQWMDFLGKELVHIREFENSETDDTDGEGQSSRGCSCIIL